MSRAVELSLSLSLSASALRLLSVRGYSCEIFRDEAAAGAIERNLEGNQQLDRFDGRHLLDGIGGGEEEDDDEEECDAALLLEERLDEERYADLPKVECPASAHSSSTGTAAADALSNDPSLFGEGIYGPYAPRPPVRTDTTPTSSSSGRDEPISVHAEPAIDEYDRYQPTIMEQVSQIGLPLSLKQALLIIGTALRTQASPQLEVLLKVKNASVFGFLFPASSLYDFYQYQRALVGTQVQARYEELQGLQKLGSREREKERAAGEIAKGLLGCDYFSPSEDGSGDEQDAAAPATISNALDPEVAPSASASDSKCSLDEAERLLETGSGSAVDGPTGVDNKKRTENGDLEQLRYLRLKRAKALSGHFKLAMQELS